jgi:hypothetical protein
MQYRQTSEKQHADSFLFNANILRYMQEKNKEGYLWKKTGSAAAIQPV